MKNRFTPHYRRLLIGLFLAAGCCSRPQPAQAQASYTVRSDHPRIWLTPTILARLRASAAANSPEWTALQNNLITYANSTEPYDTSPLNFAIAYQATGNTAYADRAIFLLQQMVDTNNTTTITRDSGFDVRNVLPTLAVGYDWCYDRLTPAQRQSFRAKLEELSDWVWPETNPSRVGGWSVNNPGDNYYHGFMMTWIVGLALYGESTKAQGYIDHALSRWTNEVVPYLTHYENGGYSLEGTNYGPGTTANIFWYLAAHDTATGQDLMNAPGFAWPTQAIRAALYTTAPDLARLYPGGEQTRLPFAPISDYHRLAPLLALTYLDSNTAGIAKWWLDHIRPMPYQTHWRWDLWQDFLWYREDIAGIDYTKTLPTGYISPGAGWMTSRSDWSDQATQVYMMCGPQRESHQDLAQNDFMIFHHDWLAATARLTSHDGLYRDTQFHNTLMIGDRGQPEGQDGLPKDQVHVVHFEEQPHYGYFAGEAKDAYAYWQWPSAVPVLNQFYRQLVFLKPNQIIVFDQVDAIDASQSKRWLLQTEQEPTISGNNYQTTLGDTTMFGTAVLPKQVTIQKVPLDLGNGGALSSWRLEISPPTGNHLDDFLNVLEVAPSSQTAATPVQTVQTSRDTLIGAQAGNQVVVFDTATTPADSVSYHLSTPASEQLVLDQTPQTAYQVSEMDPSGAVIHQQQVTASKEGVLEFQATGSGNETIVIRPASSTAGSSTSTSAAGDTVGNGGPPTPVTTPPLPSSPPTSTGSNPPPAGSGSTPSSTGTGSPSPSTGTGSPSPSTGTGSPSPSTGTNSPPAASTPPTPPPPAPTDTLIPGPPPLVPAASGFWETLLRRWWWRTGP